MKKMQILIDTDSGMDDIIAVCMLADDKNISINGIVTTRGLTNAAVGKNNFIKIFKFLGLKTDVAEGSKYPLNKIRLRNVFPKNDIINSSKLIFLSNFIGAQVVNKKSDKFMKFLFEKMPKSRKTTILCLGPLTNIAKMIKKYGTSFMSKVDRLVIMGGAVFANGNVSPAKLAEYNFFLDPEAANIVFKSGIEIVLVATDATKFVPATEITKKKIAKTNPSTNEGKIIRKVIVANNKDFRYFYDPLAAAILIDPKIILGSQQLGLKVKTSGQSIPDSKLKNVKLITKVDTKRFYKLLFQKLD